MKEGAEPVAVIADLSKVWVVAHVKEGFEFNTGWMKLEIRLVAMPDKPISRKNLSYQRDAGPRYPFGGGLDRECDNSTRLMKPEMLTARSS